MGTADAEGRLPLSRMTGWDVFPFEQAGLGGGPLGPPGLPEPARAGEGGRDCPAFVRYALTSSYGGSPAGP